MHYILLSGTTLAATSGSRNTAKEIPQESDNGDFTKSTPMAQNDS